MGQLRFPCQTTQLEVFAARRQPIRSPALPDTVTSSFQGQLNEGCVWCWWKNKKGQRWEIKGKERLMGSVQFSSSTFAIMEQKGRRRAIRNKYNGLFWHLVCSICGWVAHLQCACSKVRRAAQMSGCSVVPNVSGMWNTWCSRVHVC